MSCQNGESASNIPQITYLGLSKTSMRQGDLNQDSVWLRFNLKDGDGDISFGSNSPNRDIYLIDRRLNILQDQYKFPDLPNQNGNAIEADVSILVFTTCCLFPNQIPPCSSPVQFPSDTIRYELYVKDKAGHESNHVLSQTLTLQCL